MKIDEMQLSERLVALRKLRRWDPELEGAFESLIRTGGDFELFRVNPLAFAALHGAKEEEAIDLFLHAVRAGIFEMDWQLLCPTCGDSVKSFSTLKTLHANFRCNVCRVDTEAALDDYIEVGFTISRRIRSIAPHDPESLSIEDYASRYRFSQSARIPGGPRFIDFMFEHVRFVTYIEPGETKVFEGELGPCLLAGDDLVADTAFDVEVEGERSHELNELHFRLTKGGRIETEATAMRPGKARLEFENTTDKRRSMLLVEMPPGASPRALEFEPFLTGKRLLTTQTFRELFRSEVIQGSEGIGVKDITILFTDLKGSTELYERIGDLKAYALVRQHFDSLTKVIAKNAGAVVKTIGDAVMATFLAPPDALRAAIAILDEIERFNDGQPKDMLILKIGVHRGPTIAVTQNETLDYFGQAVNIAARVQGLAQAEEIYATEDVMGYPGARECIAGHRMTAVKAHLKGVTDSVDVYCIKRA